MKAPVENKVGKNLTKECNANYSFIKPPEEKLW